LCHDRPGAILFANRAAEDLLGRSGLKRASASVFDYLDGLAPLVDGVPDGGSTTAPVQLVSGRGSRSEVTVSVSAIQKRPRLFCTVWNPSPEPRRRGERETPIPDSSFSCIAHEIGSLSSAALLLLHALDRPRDGDDARRFNELEHVLLRVEKLARCATWSGLVDVPDDALSVTDAIDEVLLIFRPQLEAIGAHLRTDVTPALSVRAARTGFLHIVLNLVSNAHRALLAEQTRDFSIDARKHGSEVSILFKNRGRPALHPRELFTRFQPGAEQTGLGLYISRAIARSFRGDLSYAYGDGSCCFKLVLPSGDRASQSTKTSEEYVRRRRKDKNTTGR
jgi:nitrogen-specific signal transduction histidine kinase